MVVVIPKKMKHLVAGRDKKLHLCERCSLRVSDDRLIDFILNAASFLGKVFSVRRAQTQTLSCVHSIVADGYNFDIVRVLYRVCLRRTALLPRLNKVCCR